MLMLISLLNIGFLFAYGKPDWKPLLAGYLGLILQAARCWRWAHSFRR